MPEATRWLAHARAILADPRNGLAAAAPRRAGFASGAAWMQQAMQLVRGGAMVEAPGERLDRVRLAWLGVRKYALACVPAGMLAVLALGGQPWIWPLVILAFYLVEVRMVFAFPLALDGSGSPLAGSSELLLGSTSWWRATGNVMLLAAEMLFGGFCGRGFVRSWCAGCLAVVLWYEEARATSRVVA